MSIPTLRQFLIAERARWPLFTPVFFGCGIGIYFVAPPPHPELGYFLAAGSAFICAVLAFFSYRRGSLQHHEEENARPLVKLYALTALALILSGMGYAAWRSEGQTTRFLLKDQYLRELQATITRIDPLPGAGSRVWLRDLSGNRPLELTGIDPPVEAGDNRLIAYPGVQVRLSVRYDVTDFRPGQKVVLSAQLRQLPQPVYPGSFDFRRRSWFDGLSATGYATRPLERLEDYGKISDSDTGFSRWFDDYIQSLRAAIANRLQAKIPDQEGAVAAALVVGARSSLSQDIYQSMQASGLAHLLAISGMHIGLVAGLAFGFVRLLLVLAEWPALYGHTKKVAALCAILPMLIYLFLAGAAPPAQRSFLMVSLILIAVTLDRRALSMRPLAIAALCLLVIHPHALISASFQLSFAAMTALVAVAEVWRRNQLVPVNGLDGRDMSDPAFSTSTQSRPIWVSRRLPGIRRILRYFGLILRTSLAASFATAPFVLWHFGHATHVGVLANFLAIPLFAFWIMPSLMAGLLLMPLGLDGFFLYLAGEGIGLFIAIADYFASFPLAGIPLRPLWFGGLLLFIAGGIGAALLQSRVRYICLGIAMLGLASGLSFRPGLPLVLVAPKGALIGIIAQDKLWFNQTRRARFIQENWLRRTGLDFGGDFEDLSQQANSPLACDPKACLLTMPEGPRLSIARTPQAVLEDCPKVDLTFAPVFLPEYQRDQSCKGRPVLSPPDFYRHGYHLIFQVDQGFKVQNWLQSLQNHPWQRAFHPDQPE